MFEPQLNTGNPQLVHYDTVDSVIDALSKVASRENKDIYALANARVLLGEFAGLSRDSHVPIERAVRVCSLCRDIYMGAMTNVFLETDGEGPVSAVVRINDYKQELLSRLKDIMEPYK